MPTRAIRQPSELEPLVPETSVEVDGGVTAGVPVSCSTLPVGVSVGEADSLGWTDSLGDADSLGGAVLGVGCDSSQLSELLLL